MVDGGVPSAAICEPAALADELFTYARPPTKRERALLNELGGTRAAAEGLLASQNGVFRGAALGSERVRAALGSDGEFALAS